MSTNPKFSAIVAMDRSGVIGQEGDLPWRLSSDLQHFKRVTLGKPCLMGRKTWESLPFPLPGRPNLVLTRNANFAAKKAEVFTDLHAMIGRGYELAGLRGGEETMLIGGAQLYTTLLPYLDRLYVTHVEADVSGDAYFPKIDPKVWRQTDRKRQDKGPKDDYPCSFVTYVRNT
jgi:dihydrofolate reductase